MDIALDLMGAIILIAIGVGIGTEVGRCIERRNFCKVMMRFFEYHENELDKSGKDEFSNGVFFMNQFLLEAYEHGWEES